MKAYDIFAFAAFISGQLCMKISLLTMVKGVAWTVGIFGLGQLLRIVSSIILTRLLSPDLINKYVHTGLKGSPGQKMV